MSLYSQTMQNPAVKAFFDPDTFTISYVVSDPASAKAAVPSASNRHHRHGTGMTGPMPLAKVRRRARCFPTAPFCGG